MEQSELLKLFVKYCPIWYYRFVSIYFTPDSGVKE